MRQIFEEKISNVLCMRCTICVPPCTKAAPSMTSILNAASSIAKLQCAFKAEKYSIKTKTVAKQLA